MSGGRGTIILLALLALLAVPLALHAQATPPDQLWVAVDEAPLRAAPMAEAGLLARLQRGLEVRRVLAQGSWIRVRVPAGQEGWLYEGHLCGEKPPPALGSLFAPLPQSIILAEAAETARSTRSHAPARTGSCEELMAALDMRLTPEGLEAFLRQGGIGEYAKVRPQSPRGQAAFPPLHTQAPPGGEAERQVGLNLAARVVRTLAKPAFGLAQTRYVNLVGLAVARHTPGHLQGFRVVLLDQAEPVSFSLPGGLVMLSTGLLAALENEAQLALVLAHEASHAALGHLWSKALAAPFFRQGGVVDFGGAGTPLFASMLDELQDIVLLRGQDRALEFDADAAAVQMAYRAGYDPKQLARAIRRIEEAGLKSGGEAGRSAGLKNWASLHPPTAERINRVRLLLSLLPQQDGLALATERFQSSR